MAEQPRPTQTPCLLRWRVAWASQPEAPNRSKRWRTAPLQSAHRPGWPLVELPGASAGFAGIGANVGATDSKPKSRVAAARQLPASPPAGSGLLRADAVMASGRISTAPTCEGSARSAVLHRRAGAARQLNRLPGALRRERPLRRDRSELTLRQVWSSDHESKGRADHGYARQRKPSGSQLPVSGNMRGRLSEDSRLPAVRRVVRGRLNTTVALPVCLGSPTKEPELESHRRSGAESSLEALTSSTTRFNSASISSAFMVAWKRLAWARSPCLVSSRPERAQSTPAPHPAEPSVSTNRS